MRGLLSMSRAVEPVEYKMLVFRDTELARNASNASCRSNDGERQVAALASFLAGLHSRRRARIPKSRERRKKSRLSLAVLQHPEGSSTLKVGSSLPSYHEMKVGDGTINVVD
jgi:hypothetical protein